MLRTQWQREQEKEKPWIPIPRVAASLQGSEVETLASACGKTVTRLCGLQDLIRELPSLGRVKAVTYNRHALHEKVDHFHTIKLLGSEGCIQGEAVNLRLFLNHWHYSFAVQEEYDDGYRYSFQFFDRDGTAVHKVYLTADSQWETYQSLVACYQSADQRPTQSVAPIPRLARYADKEVDSVLLRQEWLALQDIQDLSALFSNFGVSRLQGLRLVGSDLATPIPLLNVQVFMEVVRDAALPLKFYVGNAGVVQIYTGFVTHIIGTAGPWQTILDTHFALRLQSRGIKSAWIVRKPGTEGTIAALELYNAWGENILQVLSPYQPRQPGYETWQRLLAALETTKPSVCSLLPT